MKNLLSKILKFQESFTTCQWGVMHITSKEIFYFTIQEKNSYNNYHIFMQFEINIIFQNETQNLVESIHLKKIISYSLKFNTKF
jgi:hypothetical protein